MKTNETEMEEDNWWYEPMSIIWKDWLMIPVMLIGGFIVAAYYVTWFLFFVLAFYYVFK